jgi:hypothetical protein
VSPDITVVGGSISDAIIDLDGIIYLQGSAVPLGTWPNGSAPPW